MPTSLVCRTSHRTGCESYGPSVGARCYRRRVWLTLLPICGIYLWQQLAGILPAGWCYFTGSHGVHRKTRLASRHNSALLQHAYAEAKNEPMPVAKKTIPKHLGDHIQQLVLKHDEAVTQSAGVDAMYVAVKSATVAERLVREKADERAAGRALVISPSWQTRTTNSSDGSERETTFMEIRHRLKNIDETALPTRTHGVKATAKAGTLGGLLAARINERAPASMSCVGRNATVTALKAAIIAVNCIKKESPERNFVVLPRMRKKTDGEGRETAMIDLHLLADA
eukprot:TRINITY_DN27292_c0_g1_i1.p1 TRINITY_DN27292_c0_g1~~TRINITY_DN27292_c0_g1_i1.p1  ORF type:complete len:283 (-),score=26.89 TRINITY_DN27292_c0_g1_i1:126-974(-)